MKDTGDSSEVSHSVCTESYKHTQLFVVLRSVQRSLEFLGLCKRRFKLLGLFKGRFKHLGLCKGGLIKFLAWPACAKEV